MKLRLTSKLILLVAVPLLSLTTVLISFIVREQRALVADTTSILRKDTRANLAQVTRDVLALCETLHASTLKQLEQNSATLTRLVDEGGGLSIDEKQRVAWKAVDQASGATQDVELGAMRIGKQWLGQTTDPKHAVPLVDRVRQLIGGAATVFQRMNEQGDMLRVATNVLDDHGLRGTGTYIARRPAHGETNPVLERVLAGETYSGRAFVVDKWYLARYTPVRDASGRITGMLFVGVPLDALTELRQAISQIKLGKSGYVWVIGASGKERGHYIVSKDQTRNGESIWESKDANGRYFIQDFVTRGEKLERGQLLEGGYPWQNKDESKPRDKLVSVGHFQPWNWVIGASVYQDEAEETVSAVQTAMAGLVEQTLTLSPLVLAAFIGLAVWMSRRMVRPLSALSGAANALAEGRVDVNVEHRSGDEIGELSEAFRTLQRYLVETARVAAAIGAGDLNVTIVPRSEADLLSNNMAHATCVLRSLLGEADRLIRATKSGELSLRGDTSKYQGGYAELLGGMNDLLNAVVEPIHEVNRALERLAARDLTARARDSFPGEYRKMVASLNTAAENLRSSLLQVETASRQVATSSSEIAVSSQSVAQGASQQASALEQTSSALVEMASATKRTAQNAQRADALANSANSASSEGAEKVHEMLAAMNKIRAAAESTATIIRDINDVAFQTNLLALNAAVEAARAGDAGRGFAVVAEEVRNLALRSKEAARKTEALIGESIGLAEQGQEISLRVNISLTEIIGAVGNVTEIVGEIARTSAEQAENIEESNKAMAQIDQMTQLAAANSEESSSAAEELAAQSKELQSLVQRFELELSERESNRPPARRPSCPSWN
jgi:methyl-accepting chemotaxis protein